MCKRIDINEKKRDQFNRMYEALANIAHNYYPVVSLRMISEEKYGLDPEEAIEMAYENMRTDASRALKGVKPFNKKDR